jgi:glycosyltransferase involved in cell wall biosynthesis
VVRHAHNRGYGAALKTGIRHARYGWIAIMDADGTYPPAALATLLDAAASGEHDMVVAARTGARVHIPLVRRPAKWVLARIASYLCARPIPDLNSGLRLMRREALARHLQLLPSGFSFTSTLTVAMLSGGEPVHFVPIDYHPRVGRSKIRPLRDTLGFLQLVLRTGLYFAPLRFFLPVSAALVALAIAITVASHVLLGRIMDATAAIVFMTAVQVVAIGLLADLIVKRR